MKEVQVVDPGPRALPPEGAVAGLHDVLRHHAPRARRGSCPKKYVEKVGEDGFKKAPIGAGPVQVRELQAGRRAGARGLRRLLAQDAQRSSAWSCAACPRRRRAPPRSSAGEVDIAYLLTGPIAEDVRRTPGLTPDRRCAPTACSSSSSPSSGIPSRRGPTGGCAWPPASPSTARRSTRPSRSASRGPPATSCRATRSSRCRSTRTPTIPRGPRSCSPRPASPTASTRATSRRSRPTTRWARRSSTTWPRSASARACARWSARRSSPRGARRSSRASSWAPPAPPATPPRGSRPSPPASGIYTYGVDPRGRGRSSSAQPRRWTARSARSCSTRSSASWPIDVVFAPIWENGFIRAYGPRVEEPGLNLIQAFPYSAPLEDVRLKKP